MFVCVCMISMYIYIYRHMYKIYIFCILSIHIIYVNIIIKNMCIHTGMFTLNVFFLTLRPLQPPAWQLVQQPNLWKTSRASDSTRGWKRAKPKHRQLWIPAIHSCASFGFWSAERIGGPSNSKQQQKSQDYCIKPLVWKEATTVPCFKKIHAWCGAFQTLNGGDLKSEVLANS